MRRTIFLALMVAAICLIGLDAAVSDDSAVTAKVKDKIVISAVSDVALGDLIPGTLVAPSVTYQSASMPVTVASNKGWQVDVSASGTAPHVGNMTDGTDFLGHALEILKKDASYGPLTDSVNIYSSATKPGTTFNTKVQQLIDYSDTPSDSYSITLTFVATQLP